MIRLKKLTRADRFFVLNHNTVISWRNITILRHKITIASVSLRFIFLFAFIIFPDLNGFSPNKLASVIQICDEKDYICLTDILKARDGEFFFSNWLRNRNTVEFLGIWEKLNNPNLNCAEFEIIKSQAGLNSYRLSAKEWMKCIKKALLANKNGSKIRGASFF